MTKVIGRVTDSFGDPVPGVEVIFTPVIETTAGDDGVRKYDNKLIVGGEKSTETDENGDFEMDLLPSTLCVPYTRYMVSFSTGELEVIDVPDLATIDISTLV